MTRMLAVQAQDDAFTDEQLGEPLIEESLRIPVQSRRERGVP
jgi:hypothetical protein